MFYLELSILIITLSLDTLIAGISMGIEKIKVPILPILILNIISTFFLFISCFLGVQTLNFLSYKITNYLPSIIFILFGIIKILETIYKNILSKEYIFKPSNIKCIFRIYHEPRNADLDYSKTLSTKELVLLGIALSLDNFIIGLGLGSYTKELSFIIISHLLFGVFFFYLLNRISIKINIFKNINSSLISGLIFIIVGFFRILI